MSLIKIIKNGKTKEIDLTPVEDLETLIEEIMMKKNSKNMSHVTPSTEIFKKYKQLSEDQKEYFVNYLILKVGYLSNIFIYSVENPEENFKYKKFFSKNKRFNPLIQKI